MIYRAVQGRAAWQPELALGLQYRMLVTARATNSANAQPPALSLRGGPMVNGVRENISKPSAFRFESTDREDIGALICGAPLLDQGGHRRSSSCRFSTSGLSQGTGASCLVLQDLLMAMALKCASGLTPRPRCGRRCAGPRGGQPALGEAALDHRGAFDRVDHACKLDQRAPAVVAVFPAATGSHGCHQRRSLRSGNNQQDPRAQAQIHHGGLVPPGGH